MYIHTVCKIILMGCYIMQFEAVLQENTSDHVHHILVYKCDDLTDSPLANSSDVCTVLHEEGRRCRRNLLISGWAVGAGVRCTYV